MPTLGTGLPPPSGSACPAQNAQPAAKAIEMNDKIADLEAPVMSALLIDAETVK